jgi:hypothetical protein
MLGPAAHDLAAARGYPELTHRVSSSSFNIGDAETALIHVDVIVNPLTETAQKWSTMLRVGVEHPYCATSIKADLT